MGILLDRRRGAIIAPSIMGRVAPKGKSDRERMGKKRVSPNQANGVVDGKE
jgi:hypothetical protein